MVTGGNVLLSASSKTTRVQPANPMSGLDALELLAPRDVASPVAISVRPDHYAKMKTPTT